jgi:hypothetical protein
MLNWTPALSGQTRLLRPAVVLLVALGAASGASAAHVGISAEITHSSIPFEGKDTLVINLTWEGEPFLYEIDQFPMPTLDKFEILGSSSSVASLVDSITRRETTVRTYRYVLKPIDFGTATIQPLNLTAKNRITGETQDLKTGALTINIAKPIPKREVGSGRSLLIIGGIVVAVLAAGAVVLMRVRKRRRTPVAVPDDRKYLQILAEIKKETVSDRKLFYSRLYRLLLQFLERERALDLAGKTGEEVIRSLESLADENERVVLTRWLEQAQKIKYQPEAPSSGDVEATFNDVAQFFKKTISNA